MPDSSTSSSGTLTSWLKKGSWSVLDQGLFAVSNFAVNVLLARWLTPEAYGAFTVAFIVFLLGGAVHGGLFVEPLLVFGASRFKERVPSYLRVLLAGHIRYAIIVAGLLGIAGLAFFVGGEFELAAALASLAVAQAFVLFLWLMRRACYIVFRPQIATLAGAVYLVLVVGSALVLNHLGWLTGPIAFLVMGGGALISGLGLAWHLGVFRASNETGLATEARTAHWEYGRWASVTGGLEWFHGALPFLVLPLFVGLEGSATLRALFNLAMPALQGFTALVLLALPVFVQARSRGKLFHTARNLGTALAGLALVYGLIVGLFGKSLVGWLYRGQYSVDSLLLWMMAGLPLFAVTAGVLMAVLRSQERPKAVFQARIGAVGAALTIGVALTATFGVVGAIASDFVALTTEALVMIGLLRRNRDAGNAEVVQSPPEDLHSDDRRLRVLVSAYACQPGRGSEPGQGWAIARGLADHHDVWLLTYPGYGFKPAIDKELCENPTPHLKAVYHQLKREGHVHLHGGQDRSGFKEQLHYYRWQITARRTVRRLHAEVGFDVVHHATLMKSWAPSALAGSGVPFVWGPVGGGESAPKAFYRGFSPFGRRYERLRDLARWVASLDPMVRRTARSSSLGLAATPETAKLMRGLGAKRVDIVDPVALPDSEIEGLSRISPPDLISPLRLLSAGRFLHWKGYDYGIRAFARARSQAKEAGDGTLADAAYVILGDGPERSRLEALACELGIAEHVHFLGMLPRASLLERLEDSHVFVHPSFHDCGGYATLEAMAAARPVLCLNLGGPGTQVTAETGFVVDAVNPEQVEADLAECILALARDRSLLARLGEAARDRVHGRYRWGGIVADLADRHREIVRLGIEEEIVLTDTLETNAVPKSNVGERVAVSVAAL